MPLYHVVLMKPKSDVTPAQLAKFVSAAHAMNGQIPGLRSLKAGSPHPSTASRSQGFQMAVIAVFDTPDNFQAYNDHPVHVSFHDGFAGLFDDLLAYDMEFRE